MDCFCLKSAEVARKSDEIAIVCVFVSQCETVVVVTDESACGLVKKTLCQACFISGPMFANGCKYHAQWPASTTAFFAAKILNFSFL